MGHPLRTLLLFLSRSRRLRRWIETSPLARRLASRFVAGSTLEEALEVARRLNQAGIRVTLDYLGENVTSLDEAARSRDMALRALAEMAGRAIDGNVSIKLTQFGLDLSEDACLANAGQLAGEAARLGNFIRVDMESSEYTERTLRLVEQLHSRSGAVGTVIQAYLYRSRKDVERLSERRIRTRLCKGAYLEPSSVAFQRKPDVDRNYLELASLLLEQPAIPAFATHDEKIIGEIERMVRERGVAPGNFEFQMLYGIRRDIQKRLVGEGYKLRLYVPFGEAWYPYFMRRLAERPANLVFLLRHLLRH
ncbi:MAG TPA: proline dehydrogenase family protein [Bryobacteraceae bacterium]|nr:proline dehydrogenase family protein [Bryobacteraceae bacterium]